MSRRHAPSCSTNFSADAVETGPATDRGVSSVISVVLMVAITVVLAGLLGTVALSMGEELREPAPRESFAVSYSPLGEGRADDAYLNVTHVGGESVDGRSVYIVDGDGNEVAWADVWTAGETVEPGEYVHVDGRGSDGALRVVADAPSGFTYRVVWRSDGGSAVLETFEKP